MYYQLFDGKIKDIIKYLILVSVLGLLAMTFLWIMFLAGFHIGEWVGIRVF